MNVVSSILRLVAYIAPPSVVASLRVNSEFVTVKSEEGFALIAPPWLPVLLEKIQSSITATVFSKIIWPFKSKVVPLISNFELRALIGFPGWFWEFLILLNSQSVIEDSKLLVNINAAFENLPVIVISSRISWALAPTSNR